MITTGEIAPNPTGKTKNKKLQRRPIYGMHLRAWIESCLKKKKKKDVELALAASIDELTDVVIEGVGGKDYLAALFANNVLGDRISKKGGPAVKATTHEGSGKYADRKYRIRKLDNGKYEVHRTGA